jgi:hypothetical protein
MLQFTVNTACKLFCGELPAQGRRIYRRNDYSDDSYQLMDQESTRRMFILLGIASSWTRNPTEEYLFCWELPAYGREIHQRNGILPGIAVQVLGLGIHWRNGYYAGIYQLMDEESIGGMRFQRQNEILQTVTIQGSVIPNTLYRECHFLFKKKE